MGKASWRLTNISALQRIKHKKDHQPETAGGLAYLCCIAGSCLILFPTFLRSSENTISGVRSKNPISRRQLVPHLQWNSPVNCCFILRPQFGQLRLLALIKVYWSLATISSADIPLASSFFNTDSASAFLDSSAAFFSAATFFASALESSFAATFKADFLLFNCSFSTLMLSDSAAISVSIANSHAQCNCRNMLFL